MKYKNQGLYEKFTVTRNDGQSEEGGKHEGCSYFVLDLSHDKFALAALSAYAEACRGEYPQLALDLVKLALSTNCEALPEVCPVPNCQDGRLMPSGYSCWACLEREQENQA